MVIVVLILQSLAEYCSLLYDLLFSSLLFVSFYYSLIHTQNHTQVITQTESHPHTHHHTLYLFFAKVCFSLTDALYDRISPLILWRCSAIIQVNKLLRKAAKKLFRPLRGGWGKGLANKKKKKFFDLVELYDYNKYL